MLEGATRPALTLCGGGRWLAPAGWESTVKVADLVRTWRLVSLEARHSAGLSSYPLGPDAGGYRIYAADGYVTVVRYRTDRARFGSQDILAGTGDAPAV